MRCSVQNLHKSQICISKMSINMQKITITRISKSRLILHGEKAAANGKVSLGDRRCSRLLVRSGSKPPSMRPSATELEALEEMSIVVPDTLILEETSEIEAPKAATVGFGVLSKVLSSPGGLREYKVSTTVHRKYLQHSLISNWWILAPKFIIREYGRRAVAWCVASFLLIHPRWSGIFLFERI